MSDKEQCEIRIAPKGKDDWILEFSGDCGETLKQLDALPPRRRRYLERRTRILD